MSNREKEGDELNVYRKYKSACILTSYKIKISQFIKAHLAGQKLVHLAGQLTMTQPHNLHASFNHQYIYIYITKSNIDQLVP